MDYVIEIQLTSIGKLKSIVQWIKIEQLIQRTIMLSIKSIWKDTLSWVSKQMTPKKMRYTCDCLD